LEHISLSITPSEASFLKLLKRLKAGTMAMAHNPTITQANKAGILFLAVLFRGVSSKPQKTNTPRAERMAINGKHSPRKRGLKKKP
jgi:hypothetical protein